MRPHRVPLGVDVAFVQPLGSGGAGQQLLHQFLVLVPVIGVGDVLQPRPDELLGRVSDHLAQRRVDQLQAALEVGYGQAGRGQVQDGTPALLGIGQGGPYASLGGDVPGDARESCGSTVLVVDHEHVGLTNPVLRTIGEFISVTVGGGVAEAW